MYETLLDRVQSLPKVELHRHLEGSMRIETLLDVARKYDRELAKLTLDELRPHVQMVPGQTFSSQEFMSKFRVLRQFYNSPETIRRIAHEVVIDAANDGVRYMELRFTPRALSNVLACSYQDVMTWVCDTVQAATTQADIEVNLIVSVNRHEGVEVARDVLDVALKYRDRGVVGIDLAGHEQGYPCEPFAPVFERARHAGLMATAHAGEWVGADSVRDSITHLGVTRIGHGIRAVEDPSLMALLKAKNIVLETCPTSNLHTGVTDDLLNHPLRQLYDAGVKTTINTDDPLISNISLTTELLDAMFNMKFALDDIKQQTLYALEGAFMPDDKRQAWMTKFKAWFNADSDTHEDPDSKRW